MNRDDGRCPEPVELVIFDCDGVLVDSEPIAVRVGAHLITELGWSVTEAEVVDRFVGRSDRYMVGEIEANVGRSLPDWQTRYEAALHAAFRSELAPVAGIVAAIDELALPTCVASSGSHDKMRLTLGLTGLYERFVGRIYSASQVANGKPAPDLFLYAAEQMDVPPSRCLVVEDSPAGVQAARAAGMRCVAYASGLVPVDRLQGPGTQVITDMALLTETITSPFRS